MVEVEILTSPHCGPCEVAKKRVSAVVEKLREEAGDIAVKLTDVAENPEAVIRYGILSTPAVALNGKLSFVGVPKEEELLNRIRREVKGQ